MSVGSEHNMSDTLAPVADAVASSVFKVEYSQSVLTGVFRSSIKFSDFPRIATLRTLFASVIVTNVVAEVRQNTMVDNSPGFLKVVGHVYVAVIPTVKDTDGASGSTSTIVNNVPNKQTFPLAENVQANEVFSFNLEGYETDLAQDPRRGAGPVCWVGNSGVVKAGGNVEVPICTVTWRLQITCSGATPLWQ